MRILLTSMITASVVLIHVLDNPALFASGIDVARRRTSELLNEKEIRIEGLKLIERQEIERVLPVSKSVGWWMSNQTSIKARIAENPWVKSVEVESCKDGVVPTLGCFRILVEERKPKFIALVDDERWIIGEDGALIIPATGNAPGMTDETLQALVPLYGLASRVSAPEKSHAQLLLAQSAISVLERAVERPVESITFEGRGDISVAFSRVPFPVVFGTSSPDNLGAIEDQGARLKALLSHLSDRLAEIQRIDLAFSKVGVVKFKPAPKPDESSTEK